MSNSSTKDKVQLLKEWLGSERTRNVFKIKKYNYKPKTNETKN